MSMLAGIPIGIYSSIRQDSVGDYFGRSIAILAISVPHFWVGIMVMLYPSIYWNWSPPIEYVHLTEDPIANIKMMLIPAAILAMILAGQVMRMTRTMMLEVLRQDYGAPAPPFHAGSGRRHERCWPGPRAAGTSARRRFRRR